MLMRAHGSKEATEVAVMPEEETARCAMLAERSAPKHSTQVCVPRASANDEQAKQTRQNRPPRGTRTSACEEERVRRRCARPLGSARREVRRGAR